MVFVDAVDDVIHLLFRVNYSLLKILLDEFLQNRSPYAVFGGETTTELFRRDSLLLGFTLAFRFTGNLWQFILRNAQTFEGLYCGFSHVILFVLQSHS